MCVGVGHRGAPAGRSRCDWQNGEAGSGDCLGGGERVGWSQLTSQPALSCLFLFAPSPAQPLDGGVHTLTRGSGHPTGLCFSCIINPFNV